jgi:hypothetical protein
MKLTVLGRQTPNAEAVSKEEERNNKGGGNDNNRSSRARNS